MTDTPSTNTIVQPECDHMRRHGEALAEADGDDVEAIIQFGANLAFGRQAAVHGYGSLLERH